MTRLRYEYGCPVGTWKARFDFKEWGQKGNLRLFFTDLESGGRHFLCTFWDKSYQPTQGGPDFHREVSGGQFFELETGHTRNGTPKLIRAEPLRPPLQSGDDLSRFFRWLSADWESRQLPEENALTASSDSG
jgi:hypothetical protein